METPTDPPEIVLSDETRVARLSHTQWENAVRDLLGLDAPLGLSAAFLKDAKKGRFDNEDVSLGVDPVLFQQYSAAAWVVADTVIRDPAVHQFVVGGPLTEEFPEDFVRRFGRKAHREPLTDEQVAQYAAAWQVGLTQAGGGDPVSNGLRQLLASMFSSPFFLYRVETAGEVQDGTTVVRVNPHDLAARLSFALWNTVPDAELEAAADEGTLRDEAVLRAQVDRMLADPRAATMIEDLHDQLYLVDLYVNVAPDTVLYPDYDPDTVPAMQEEVRAFVQEVLRSGGGVHELMTSRKTFVNPLLAEVYGLEGVPDSGRLEPVELDPRERAGLFTLSGFLSSQADPNVSNPIKRGFYINDFIICQPLGSPPPFAAAARPPVGEELTTRETITAMTGECGVTCHTMYINPVGFAFEHYGPIGEYRTDERGLEIDATGEYPFAEGVAQYDGAIEFAEHLAASSQVHDCYAQHVFEYLYGRYPDWRLPDSDLVEAMGTASLAGGLSMHDLVRDLVLDPDFRLIPPDLDDDSTGEG